MYCFAPQTLENIKLVQIAKFHKAKSEFERDSIELDAVKILHQAVDNSKPLLILKKVHRAGVLYEVHVLLYWNTLISAVCMPRNDDKSNFKKCKYVSRHQ